MTALHDLLDPYVKEGAVPGAVALLLARGDDVTAAQQRHRAGDGPLLHVRVEQVAQCGHAGVDRRGARN